MMKWRQSLACCWCQTLLSAPRGPQASVTGLQSLMATLICRIKGTEAACKPSLNNPMMTWKWDDGDGREEQQEEEEEDQLSAVMISILTGRMVCAFHHNYDHDGLNTNEVSSCGQQLTDYQNVDLTFVVLRGWTLFPAPQAGRRIK